MSAIPSPHVGACHASPRAAVPSVLEPRGRALSLVSTVLLVLMPKCPFCFVGWMGALGVGSYATEGVVIPTAVLALFCASQAVFFFTARRTGDWRSLAVAAAGVAALLAGTLLHLGAAVSFGGAALVVTASIVNAIATTRAR